MNFVADEGVDRPIVVQLRRDGHHVESVAELEPGIPDTVVLERARQGGLLLLTSDKDFGELIFRQGSMSRGVVLLRLAGLPPARKAEIVSACITEHGEEMQDCFSVLTSTSLRIRRQIP